MCRYRDNQAVFWVLPGTTLFSFISLSIAVSEESFLGSSYLDGGFDASIIKPLAQNYAGQMLESLAKHTKKPPSHGPVSKTEEPRIVRGLYRFQLYCCVFGVGNMPDHRCLSDLRKGSGDEIFKIVTAYEPWEAEEIFCVHNFSRKKFSKVFDDMFEDLNDHPGHSRFRELYPLSRWTFDMEDEGWYVSVSVFLSMAN